MNILTVNWSDMCNDLVSGLPSYSSSERWCKSYFSSATLWMPVFLLLVCHEYSTVKYGWLQNSTGRSRIWEGCSSGWKTNVPQWGSGLHLGKGSVDEVPHAGSGDL